MLAKTYKVNAGIDENALHFSEHFRMKGKLIKGKELQGGKKRGHRQRREVERRKRLRENRILLSYF